MRLGNSVMPLRTSRTEHTTKESEARQVRDNGSISRASLYSARQGLPVPTVAVLQPAVGRTWCAWIVPLANVTGRCTLAHMSSLHPNDTCSK